MLAPESEQSGGDDDLAAGQHPSRHRIGEEQDTDYCRCDNGDLGKVLQPASFGHIERLDQQEMPAGSGQAQGRHPYPVMT